MNKSVIFQILLCLILLGGCQSEDIVKGNMVYGSHSLVATVEGHEDTNASRTVVDDNGNVTWIQTDELGVYGNQTQNAKYVSTGSGASVTFTGNLDSETDEVQWAYYPYEESASLADGVLSLNLPSEYEYTGNSNAPMIGKKTESNKLAFKHLSSLIRFTLGGGMPKNADRFVITSKGENQPIAGQVSFDVDADNTTLTITGEGTQQITYRLDKIAVVEEFQHFFVPLPVGAYDKLEVAFYLKNSETPVFTRSISNLNVKRAQMVSMPILNWNTGEQYILNEDAKDLSASMSEDITVSLESNTSLIYKNVDKGHEPKVGDVLWSRVTDKYPNGFLGKVSKVTKNSDGSYTVETETAALNEAFDQLYVNETISLCSEEVQTRALDWGEVKYGIATEIPIKFGEKDSPCYCYGKIDLGGDLNIFIDLDDNRKLEQAYFTYTSKTAISLGLEFDFSTNDESNVIKKELKEFPIIPLSFAGGLIRINTTVQPELFVIPRGSINSHLAANFEFENVSGASYVNGKWEKGMNKPKSTANSPIDFVDSGLNFEGEIQQGISFEFNGKLYNRDDLKFYMTPSLGLKLKGAIEINHSNSQDFEKILREAKLESCMFAAGEIGFDYSIFWGGKEFIKPVFELPEIEFLQRDLKLIPFFEKLMADLKNVESPENSSLLVDISTEAIGESPLKDLTISFEVENSKGEVVEESKPIPYSVPMPNVLVEPDVVIEEPIVPVHTTFENLKPTDDYKIYPIIQSPILESILPEGKLALKDIFVEIKGSGNLRQQLIQLYNSAGGENWTHKENWLTDEPIEHWEGVHRNKEGKYSIELGDNNLTGTVTLSSSDIQRINVSGNNIEHLSLSGCTGLEYAEYGNNPLLALDLSDCSVVRGYYSMGDENTYSKIKQLKMTDCKELTDVYIEMPMLESLDLSGCEKLRDIPSIHGETQNTLTSVNISGCKEISELSSLDNVPLKYLNISGCEKITYLRPLSVGMPRVIEELYAADCTGLTGQVGIYPTMRILDLENCTALESVAYNSANNDEYQLTSLNVMGCTSLEFITVPRGVYLQEFNMVGCKQLKKLDMYLDNCITDIDLSECTMLEEANIEGRQLQSLDVTDCSSLKYLSFSGVFTTIDLSNNRELEYLNTSQALTELDLTYNHELKELSCSYGNIKSLDLAGKRKLERVHCGGNQLEFLDVSGCYSLKDLQCSNGLLATLDVSDCGILETLQCDNNRLTALDLTQNVNLTRLYCYDNAISELNVSGCVNLKDLRCQNNPIKDLDIKNLVSLEYISCNNSILETLDVSGCAKITSLRLSGCPNLSSLNIAGCSSINDMYLYNTGLTNISLTGMSSLTDFSCNGNDKLTSLDLAGCTNLVTLDCANNPELVNLTLMSRAPLVRIHFDGTKVTHEIPSWFPLPNPNDGIYFTYEQRYTDYKRVWNSSTQSYENTYMDKGYGWWYPGEPTKGRHSRD